MKGEPQRGKYRLERLVQPGRLRALRLAARYTQHALARACGVSVNTIWLLEHGRQPSIAMLRKLRRLLRRVTEDDTHGSPPSWPP